MQKCNYSIAGKPAKHIINLAVLAMFLLCTRLASAQCEVTIDGSGGNDAVISVGSGAFFGTEGNITFQNGTAGIDNQGTVEVKGNWTQNAASGGLLNAGTGIVILDGANQTVGGSISTTFSSLTLGGTGIKTLGISATVTGTLNLTDRELATGTNILTITTTGTIINTSGFVSSLSGGYLARNTNSTGTYFFPVGGPNGGLFRPMEISPATTTSNTFNVRFVPNNPTVDGYTATTTDGTICSANPAFYHQVTQSGATAAIMTMYYSSAIDGSLTRMAHWQSSQWANMTPYSFPASPYSGVTNGVSVSGWNNFSSPAFALAIPVTPLPPVAAAATSVACNSFTANWAPATDANHLAADILKYYLDVATDAAFTSIVSGYNGLDVGNVTTWNVTGLSTGTNYYYRLRAMNSCGTSSTPYTVTGPVQTVTASVAPTSLSAANTPPVCPGYSTTLTQSGGSLGTGTSWKWYSNSSYTTLVGTGSGANASLVVTPAVTTTYYLRIEGGTFPCTANLTGPAGGVTVTVTVIPTVAPLTGNQTITCGGTTVFSNAPTGGTITTAGGYRIHSFLSSGTFVVPSSFLGTVDVLVVGGGGGGGADMGGGGGGGGVLYNTNFAVTPGTSIPVTVGAGGAGAANGNNVARGTNGSPSTFSSITALGGGGGASRHDGNNNPAGTGSGVVGSGGGCSGAGNMTSGYGGAPGVGTPGQGNNGGGSAAPYTWYPGGGGGAGSAGTSAPANGGAGVANAILGTTYYWGAGGGGAGYTNIAGNGGIGGGGGGAPKVSGGGLAGTGGLNAGTDGAVGILGQQTNVPGGNGAENTGSGGGGGSHYNNGNHGGAGGSGIVIVRYPDVTNGVWSSSNTAVATVNSSGVVTGVGAGTATISFALLTGGCTSTVVTRDVTVNVPTLAPITGNTTICAGTSSNLVSSSPYATGGNVSVVGGYRIHTFTSSSSLSVTRGGNMEVLVVAGGGGGGTNMGGGGGGGGVIAIPSFPVAAGTIAVTVGAGGAGAPAGTCSTSPCHPTVPGNNGGNSIFGSLTAIGGGAGGYSYNSLGTSAGVSGGSGGGASGYNDNSQAIGVIKGGSGTPGQGYQGGYQGNAYYSGGGGGAGGPGSNGNGQPNGGPGVLNSILGTPYYWGGGGGGAAYTLATGGNGGIGGGGGGAVGTTTGGAGLNNGSAGGGGCSTCWANTPGGNGGANTGGGGGGGAHYYSNNKGGNGGSGIVVVKYFDGADGVWSSSNTSVATIDPSTGVVTGVAAGTSTITYTVTIGSCSASQSTVVTVNNTAAPSASASPASVCPGGTSNLNGVSAGNTINWYTASSGGTKLGTTASGANFPVTPSGTTTYYAEAASNQTGSQTFSSTGAVQTFIVPAGITSVTIDAYGAQGTTASCAGGLGGRSQGTLAVTPGQTLLVYVGSQSGFNGGGTGGCLANCGGNGGGASDIRVGGSALANRVIVAGGGGGGGGPATSWNCGVGGVGGGLTGGNGTGSSSNLGIGLGGTQSAGGTTSNGGCGNGISSNGSLGQGGAAVNASSWSAGGAGGGGGGYYGGGAGSYCGDGGGGGGGSSYIGGVTGGSTIQGVRTGNGQVIISWNGDACLSTRTPVVVTTNPVPPTPSAVTASPAGVCQGGAITLTATSAGSTAINWYAASSGGSVLATSTSGVGVSYTPPASGTFTYYAEAVNSVPCPSVSRTATSAVTVTAIPAAPTPVTASPSIVCANATSNLNATSAGNSIRWYTASSGGSPIGTSASGANFAVNPSTTTIYYAETFAAGLCASLSRTAVTVTVHPIPAPTAVTVAPTTICAGNTVSLTASGLVPGGQGSNTSGVLSLNGASYVDVAANAAQQVAANTDFTYEMWVNPTSFAAGNNTYFENGQWSGQTVLFRQDNASSINLYVNGVALGAIAYAPTLGTWTHLALVRSGGASGIITLYANGISVGNFTAYAAAINPTVLMRIGSSVHTTGQLFNGYIDEFRFWKGVALPVATMNSWRSLELNSSHPNWANLSFEYKFNGSYANAQGGSPTGTPVGAPTFAAANYYTYTWAGDNAPAGSTNEVQTCIPVTGGTYTVVASRVCLNSSPASAPTASVTVNTRPAAPTAVTSTPSSFCIVANTIQLNATAAGSTIYWYTVSTGGSSFATSASGANLSVSPTATTTYYAEAVSISNGCASLTRTPVTVTMNPTPVTPSPITGVTQVCVGSTTTLASSPFATGGNVSVVNGYRIHTFLSSGSINITQPGNAEVLVVAGGGGGGTDMGGGGGGGGVVYNPSISLSAGSMSVTVGNGGAGAPAGIPSGGLGSGPHPSVPGGNGGNSVFGSITALGGGRGGMTQSAFSLQAGAAGGSGGGASGYNNLNVAGGTVLGGAGTSGQGFRGGWMGTQYYSGGGGGAGGAGGDGNYAANGGQGVLNAILGTPYYWGGGGGGAGYSICGGNGGAGGGGGGAICATTGGSGLNPGQGGGGGGGGVQANTPGGNAGANTGGGGGGGAHYDRTNKGGDGGSGIVIVKYPDASAGVWSSSNTAIATVDPSTGVVTGVAQGTVTITYTLNIGTCTSTTTTTVTVNPNPAAPAPVTATPAAICLGNSSALNATSAGANIEWYTASTGGSPVGMSLSGANFVVTPSTTTTYYAEAASLVAGNKTFSYTGGLQTFTVPAGVTSITLDAYGAQGANNITFAGGLGGRAQGTLAVTPGQVINIQVGGQTGYNGGGEGGIGGPWPGVNGGGATDVRVGGTALANRVLVAGGGGGGGSTGNIGGWPGGAGGAGGGTTAASGYTCCGTAPTGGSQVAGGAAGNGCNNCGNYSTAGTLGNGGIGDKGCNADATNGWYGAGSGGGGGYYGGGGGESCGSGASGGGGSSYTGGVTSPTNTAGVRSGNGQLIISWVGDACLSPSRTPVTVTVNSLPTANAGAALSAICKGGTSAPLGGSVGGAATGGTWSDGGVGGTFNTGATDLNTTWTPPASYSGSATLTLTTSGGFCPAVTASKVQVVSPLPTANAGGAIAQICQGSTSAALGGSIGGSATGGIWSDGGAGGTFNPNATTLNATYTPSSGFSGTVTFTLTTTGGPCAAVTATNTMVVNPTIVPGVVTGAPAVAGNGTTITYTASGFTSGASFSRFQYQWNSTSAGGWTDWGTTNPYAWVAGNVGNTLYVRSVIISGACVVFSPPVSTIVTVDNIGWTGASQPGNPGYVPAAGTCGNWSAAWCAGSGTYTYANLTQGISYTIQNLGTAACGTSMPNAYIQPWFTGGSTSCGWGEIGEPGLNSITFNAAVTGSHIFNVTSNPFASNNACGLAYGWDGTSSSAYLQYKQNTTVAASVAPISNCNGVTVPLIATLSGGGNNPAVSWSLIGGGGSLSGANYLPGTYAGSVTVRATVGVCSGDVTFTINGALTSGSVGGTQTICYNTAPTAFTNTVTPTGGTGSYTYQWQSSPDNSNWTNISGATSATYAAGALTALTYFRRVETSGSCGSVNSNVITVTVQPPSAGGIVFSAQTICYNSQMADIGLNSQTGTVVKWQSSNDNFVSNSNDISNTTAVLSGASQGNLTQDTWFRAVVQSGSGCVTANSAAVKITVTPGAVGGAVASDQTICYNTTMADVTLSGQTGVVLKWQKSTDNFVSNFTDISNTTNTLTGVSQGNLTQDTWFRAMVQNGAGCTPVASVAVKITVSPASGGGAVASAQSVCYNSTMADLTLSGQTGSVVKWQSSTDNFVSNSVDIASTSTTLAGSLVGNLIQDTWFRAVVQSGGSCATAASNAVKITIDVASGGGTVSSAQTICANSQMADLALAGQTGTIVKWQRSNDNFVANVTDITNTSATLTGSAQGNLTQDTWFRAVVQNGTVCPTAVSTTVKITIGAGPDLSSLSVSAASPVCAGGISAVTINSSTLGNGTFSVIYDLSGPNAATGLTGPLNINAGSGTFNTPILAATGTTTITITSVKNAANCSSTPVSGNTTSVTVNTGPSVSIINAEDVCISGEVTLGTSVSGGAGSSTNFMWERSANGGGSWSTVQNTASATYLTSSALGTGSYLYKVTLTQSGSNCSALSSSVSANVVQQPYVNDPSATVELCKGGSTSFVVTQAGGGTPTLIYEWEYLNNSLPVATGDPVGHTYTGGNTATLGIATDNTTAATGVTTYWLKVYATGNGCLDAYSLSYDLNVNDEPAVSNPSPASQSGTCGGGSITPVTVTASGGSGTYSYQWYAVSTNTTSGGTPVGTNSDSFTPPSTSGTVYYYCVVSQSGDGCGPVTTAQAASVTFSAGVTATATVDECVTLGSIDKYYVLVTATGGTMPYSYPGAFYTATNSQGVNQGIYEVAAGMPGNTFVVQDANGCSGTTAPLTTPAGHPIDIAMASATGMVTADCWDSDFNRWVTFREPVNNDAIIAIQDNHSDLGLVTVSVYKDASAPLILSDQYTQNGGCGGTSTAMRRHYKVTTTRTPTTGVDVALFFTDQEYIDLKNDAFNSNIPYPQPGYECSNDDDVYNFSGLYVTKYSGGNEDGDYMNNLASGVYKVYGDNTTPYLQLTKGEHTSANTGFQNIYGGNQTHHYVQLTVTEFSEFWIHGSSHAEALPVEMIFLQADAINNAYIQLTWATATEVNNKGFEVERSTDGQTWINIGWVDGHNNTTVQVNYSFNDIQVVAGVVYYYRLKQVDNDLAFEYTDIVSARLTADVAFTVKDFVPNPTMDKTSLVVTSGKEQEITVTFYNVVGQKVMESIHSLNKGGNKIEFNMGALASGTYTAIVTSDKEVYTKKVVLTK